MQSENTITILCRAKDIPLDEIIEPTFDHARSTSKKGGKPDFFALLVAVIAAACFGYMLYTCIKHDSFSFVNVLLMVIYLGVGIASLNSGVQYRISYSFWKSGLKKRCLSYRMSPLEVVFGGNELSYPFMGRSKETDYDDIPSIYETESCIIFHLGDKDILPVAKSAILEAGEGSGDELLASFRALLRDAPLTDEEKAAETVEEGSDPESSDTEASDSEVSEE